MSFMKRHEGTSVFWYVKVECACAVLRYIDRASAVVCGLGIERVAEDVNKVLC
jgi:hypothetical protein